MSLLIGLALLVLAGLYARRMLRYGNGWKYNEEPRQSVADVPVSVVIPARNEAENIRNCLHSIFGGSYPNALLEVIVVDDASDDGTPEEVVGYRTTTNMDPERLRLVRLPRDSAPARARKKEAVDAGIRASTGTVVFTTDADCRVPENWIAAMLGCFEPEVVFTAGPVAYDPAESFWQRLQALEFFGWIGIGAGGIGLGTPEICNAANMAFLREAWLDLPTAHAGDTYASGDDVFLMSRFTAAHPKSIRFCRSTEALVKTPPNESVRAFFEQRKRWASKSPAYTNAGLRSFVWITGVLSAGLILALVLTPLWHVMPLYVLAALLVKSAGDLAVIRPVLAEFEENRLLRLYPVAALLQPLYVAFAGPLGLLRGFEWKGRRLRQ